MSAIILASLAGLITAAMLSYLLFDDLDDFWECIRFLLTPDFISLLFGKWHEDRWAEIKLLLLFGLSLAVGVLTYVNIK